MGIASFPNCFYNVFDGAGSFSAAGQLNSFPVFALSSPVVFRTFVFIFATSSGSSVHTFVVYAFSVWPIFSPANPSLPPHLGASIRPLVPLLPLFPIPFPSWTFVPDALPFFYAILGDRYTCKNIFEIFEGSTGFLYVLFCLFCFFFC